VNLFCTSAIDSPLSILNISYSCIRVCFLALFTSFVPSWVTYRVFHISLADTHCEILENSSEFKAEVMIFLAIQSNLAFYFQHLSIGDENQKYINMTKDAILEGSSQQANKEAINRRNGQGRQYLKFFVLVFLIWRPKPKSYSHTEAQANT